MQKKKSTSNLLEAVPVVLAGKDWRSISLTPEESFILSRIDGASRIADIIAVTGLEEEKVLSTVTKLARMKVIKIPGYKLEEQQEDTDLSPQERKEIDDFLKALSTKNYFEILGVDPSADVEDIKDASLMLIRRFHPDRFFRRKLGPYKKKLEHIIMRIQAITETLTNPQSRKVYAQAFGKSAKVSQATQEKYEALRQEEEKKEEEIAKPRQEKAPRATTSKKLHRGKDADIIRERVQKARNFYREALSYEEKGDIKNAIINLQLAVAYDPFCKEYQEKLSQLKNKKPSHSWQELYERALKHLSEGEVRQAERLLTECILQKPASPDPYRDLISILMEEGHEDKALEIARIAVRRFENNVELRLILVSIYEKLFQYDRALAEMKKVLKFIIKTGQIVDKNLLDLMG